MSGARRLTIAWLGGYLLLSGAILAAGADWALVALHLALIVVLWRAADDRTTMAAVVGDLLPLLVAPLLYGEIPRLIAVAGTSYHDALIGGWETRLFGGQPSHSLAGALPLRALSELLHAGYLAYYPVIFAPPVWLWFTKRRGALHATVLALTITYTVCWAMYVAFPVEGPRYLWVEPPGVPSGLFRGLVTRILAAGSSRGAAFPSSHMAVSTAQAVMAWRWLPRAAPVLTAVALLVGVGAVYGGFHYATDMLAGAALGLVASGIVRRCTR